jgi:hypothetical protein
MLSIYLEAVSTLAKATGNRVSSKSIKSIHALLDQHEPAVLRAVQSALVGARRRFTKRFKVANVVQRFEGIGKSLKDDVLQYITAMVAASYGDEFTQEITDALEPIIKDIIVQLTSEYKVTPKFDVVNAQAVEYLQEHADNLFSQISDDQAQAIFDKISFEMSSESGYTLKNIVTSIRDNYLSDSMYFSTANGIREMQTSDWAYTVARTETARAASFSQRSTLESIGMKTWQWNVQSSGCDVCDSNADEIVVIGDAFPSGDTEPPAHPNCRCIVTAVIDELTTLDDSAAINP